VTFGELKRISSALGIELGEIFFAPEERREEKGPRVLPSGETAFSVEARDAGYRLVSYFPPSPDIFLGKIFVRAETRLPSCRVPRVEKVFLLMLMGELRVERPGEIHELKAGDALLFPGRLPYEIENPILRESAAFLVTVPAPRL